MATSIQIPTLFSGGPIAGAIGISQVAYGTSADTIGGSDSFTYDGSMLTFRRVTGTQDFSIDFGQFADAINASIDWNGTLGATIMYLESDYVTTAAGDAKNIELYAYFDVNTHRHQNLYCWQPDLNGGVTVDIMTHLYLGELSGTITHPYYLFSDSRGVLAVREDRTYNSVAQAVASLYNPQVTKFTPGQANYERVILGQWNTNVAEIGTEKGGTGTLRMLRLLGGGLFLAEGGIIPAADPHVLGQVWANSHVLTVSAG